MPYQTPAQRAIVRNRTYRYQVSVKRFRTAVKEDQILPLHLIALSYPNGQHWRSYQNVDGDHTRVFGFRTEEELFTFKMDILGQEESEL